MRWLRRRPRPAPPDPSAQTMVEEPGRPPIVEDEYVPPARPPRPNLWPWLLLLLLLVVGGLLAAYFLTRDNDDGKTNKAASAVTVPRVVGLKQNAAVRRLNDSGLTPEILAGRSRFSAGTVFAQDPRPGTEVSRRSRVRISVATVTVTRVPNVVGARTAVAVRRLRATGLKSQVTSVAAKAAAGVVVAEAPAAGENVAKGSTVSLRVSKGQATVPDVRGQLVADATAALRATGLVPATFKVPGSEPKGTVTAQKPSPGKKVPRGSKVQINVSTGSAATSTAAGTTTTTPPSTSKVRVPNVVGLQQAAAQRRLAAAGLRSRANYVSSSKPSGQVVAQNPTAGTRAVRGSRVRLSVSLGPSGTTSVAVPDVVGQTQQDAVSTLGEAGFEVQVLMVDTGDPSQSGIVVDEQPGGGSRAPQGSTVTIYVGRTS